MGSGGSLGSGDYSSQSMGSGDYSRELAAQAAARNRESEGPTARQLQLQRTMAKLVTNKQNQGLPSLYDNKTVQKIPQQVRPGSLNRESRESRELRMSALTPRSPAVPYRGKSPSPTTRKKKSTSLPRNMPSHERMSMSSRDSAESPRTFDRSTTLPGNVARGSMLPSRLSNSRQNKRRSRNVDSQQLSPQEQDSGRSSVYSFNRSSSSERSHYRSMTDWRSMMRPSR